LDAEAKRLQAQANGLEGPHKSSGAAARPPVKGAAGKLTHTAARPVSKVPAKGSAAATKPGPRDFEERDFELEERGFNDSTQYLQQQEQQLTKEQKSINNLKTADSDMTKVKQLDAEAKRLQAQANGLEEPHKPSGAAVHRPVNGARPSGSARPISKVPVKGTTRTPAKPRGFNDSAKYLQQQEQQLTKEQQSVNNLKTADSDMTKAQQLDAEAKRLQAQANGLEGPHKPSGTAARPPVKGAAGKLTHAAAHPVSKVRVTKGTLATAKPGPRDFEERDFDFEERDFEERDFEERDFEEMMEMFERGDLDFEDVFGRSFEDLEELD